ncbi:hypothetical protein E2C01_016803 [Portunus trituberculatus]|uniref:Transmembrane protein n=1 Tax=Portunus trituberculatus TaxID=210409 RepID=A0A5B7DRX3_PORTR|nr:hypothetical protein [Portunus trituberculatus]
MSDAFDPIKDRYPPVHLNHPAISVEAAAPLGLGFSPTAESGFPCGCNQARPETPDVVVQWVTIACRDNFLKLYLSIYCSVIWSGGAVVVPYLAVFCMSVLSEAKR